MYLDDNLTLNNFFFVLFKLLLFFHTFYNKDKHLIAYKSNQIKILNNHSSGDLFSMFLDLGYACTKQQFSIYIF
ncbi:hypothetical protein QTP88_025674 [Uroleucon formosanum]